VVDGDDGIGEGARRLLRQVVADAALDEFMLVLAGETLGIRGRFRVRTRDPRTVFLLSRRVL